MAESARRKYVRRPDRPVAAVRLSLETDGLVYRKWGGVQRAKQGDWIVDNDGDVYTVDAQVFERTYRPGDPQKAPGSYVKTTPVWAERARQAFRERFCRWDDGHAAERLVRRVFLGEPG